MPHSRPARRPSLPASPDAAGEETTVDEVAARYRGRWILVQVTERDAFHAPTRGKVVATGPSRHSIQPSVRQEMTETQKTGAESYVFGGAHRIRSGAEWAAALGFKPSPSDR